MVNRKVRIWVSSAFKYFTNVKSRITRKSITSWFWYRIENEWKRSSWHHFHLLLCQHQQQITFREWEDHSSKWRTRLECKSRWTFFLEVVKIKHVQMRKKGERERVWVSTRTWQKGRKSAAMRIAAGGRSQRQRHKAELKLSIAGSRQNQKRAEIRLFSLLLAVRKFIRL